MQILCSRIVAILFTASLLSQASAASPPPESPPLTAATPRPTEVPPGPRRPDRTKKFEDRPSISWTELQFADDDVQHAACCFHEFADALVTAPRQAERYKDITSSNHPNYMGTWTIPEKERRLSLSLHGQTLAGVDRFHRFEAMSRAQAGIWSAESSIHCWPKTSQYKPSVSLFLQPIDQPSQPDSLKRNPFYLLSRGINVAIEEGSLRYLLQVNLPHSTDRKRNTRLMYDSPETFHELVSEDLESLRKLAKQELGLRLTVYDERQVSSARPPYPLPVEKLTAQTRSKIEAAIDARIDAELAILKTDFRDMHAAVQLALPRALFDSQAPAK